MRAQQARETSSSSSSSSTMTLGERPQPSDAELMQGIAAGDREAFAELFDRYAPTATALARRILRQTPLAEEAVQEAFLAVWRQPKRYLDGRGSVRSWLLSMVHHRAVDVVRREQSQRDREEGLASSSTWADEIADPFEETLVRELGMAEQERVVRNALEGLPGPQHQIITLMYFDGLTQTQISNALSIPLGTVKSRSLLGMRRLRTALVGIER